MSEWTSATTKLIFPNQAAFLSNAASTVQPTGYDISDNNNVAPSLANAAAFIFHKCSEGTYHTDEVYLTRRSSFCAVNPGLHWGATHFMTGGDINKQVQRLLQSAAPDGKTVIALDIEHNPDTSALTGGDATLLQVASMVLAIQVATGKYPVIYTRKSWWDPLVGTGVNLAALNTVQKCPLWLASEDKVPAVPQPWGAWQFQQYTQARPIAASAPIDVDRWWGDQASLDAFWTENATSAPVAPPTGNRISLHVMAGANNNAVYDLLEATSRAGKALPGMTLVKYGWSGEMQVGDILAHSPNTRVMLRHYVQAWDGQGPDWSQLNLYAAGANFMSLYYSTCLSQNADSKRATWHQIINEPGYGAGTASWWTGALDVAESLGLKLAVGCFGTGNPKLPDETGNIWPSLYDLLRRVKARGHVLMLHQYIDPDPGGAWDSLWEPLRNEKLIPLLPSDIQDVPVAIGEFGTRFGSKLNDADLLAGLKTAEASFVNDRNVIYAGCWTVGGAGAWADSLLDGHLAALKAYLLGG